MASMTHLRHITAAAPLTLLFPLAASAAFTDVSDSHLHAEAILYVQENGIVSGYEDGTYRPDNKINRAEFTKIIVEATGGADASTDCFPDVAKEWFATFVCTAKARGIVGGYADGTFKPGDEINAVEGAKIIVNGFALDKPAVGGAWHAPFMLALEAEGAIPADLDALGQTLTRGQMAEIIYRLHARVSTKPSKTYAQLGGEASAQSSSRAASVKSAAAAASKAAATALELSISADWLEAWQVEGSEYASLYKENVEVGTEANGQFKSFLRMKFPKGSGNAFLWASYGKPLGGFVGYVEPDVTPSQELWARYWVRFPKDFDFHKGGLLPGLMAGMSKGNDVSTMAVVSFEWEKDGKMRLVGDFMGDSQNSSNIVQGADSLKADGQWHRVDLHVRLNSHPSKFNGLIDLWYDGVMMATTDQALFSAKSGQLWDGLLLSATMGNRDLGSISPKDQYLDLAGFTFSTKPFPKE
jgi:hypothetical protein